MRARTTLILAILLILVAAFYYVAEVKGKWRKGEAEAPAVFSLAEAEVEGLNLERPTETVQLLREGDGWRMGKPVEAKGDKGAIESLIATLRGARIERTVEDRPPSLADFGLDKPAVTVTVKLKGRDRPEVLQIGSRSPTETWAYAKRPGDSAVFLVTDLVKRDAEKTATDLRDKSLFAFEASKVTGVEVAGKDATITVSKDPQEGWRLTRPLPVRADEFAVADLIRAVREARAKEFVAEDGADPARFGLARPQVRVTLREEGDKATYSLALAKAAGKKEGAYAMARPGKGIVLVDARLLGQLTKSPMDLRERRLLVFEDKDVARVRVRRGTVEIGLERQGDRWRLAGSPPAEALEGRVFDLLFTLRTIRFKDVVAERGGDPARYGLAAPQVEVFVTRLDGKELPALLLGRVEKDTAFAMVRGAPTIYAVEAKVLEQLPKDAATLKKEERPKEGQ